MQIHRVIIFSTFILSLYSLCFQRDEWITLQKKLGTISRDFDIDFLEQNTVKGSPNYLGGGGFGKVYKMHYKPFGSKNMLSVALKVTDIEGKKSTFVNLVRSEMKVFRFLSERFPYNVPKFYTCLHHGTKWYVISELLDYNLSNKLFMRDFQSFPLYRKLEVLLGMARGLSVLHINGLTHNDVKLDNFMIDMTNNRNVKIIDFGFVSNRNVKLICGTLPYMAPEIFILGKDYRTQDSSDKWSLGISMIELWLNGLSTVSYGKKCMNSIPKVKQCKTMTIINFLNTFSENGQPEYLNVSILPSIYDSLKSLIFRLIHQHAGKRPALLSVVEALEGFIRKENPESKFLPENIDNFKANDYPVDFHPYDMRFDSAKQVDLMLPSQQIKKQKRAIISEFNPSDLTFNESVIETKKQSSEDDVKMRFEDEEIEPSDRLIDIDMENRSNEMVMDSFELDEVNIKSNPRQTLIDSDFNNFKETIVEDDDLPEIIPQMGQEHAQTINRVDQDMVIQENQMQMEKHVIKLKPVKFKIQLNNTKNFTPLTQEVKDKIAVASRQYLQKHLNPQKSKKYKLIDSSSKFVLI